MDTELARRNVRLGWALFALFIVIFAGTFLVGWLYLQFD